MAVSPGRRPRQISRREFLALVIASGAAFPAYWIGSRSPETNRPAAEAAPITEPAQGPIPEVVQVAVPQPGRSSRRLPPMGLTIPSINVNTQVVSLGAKYDNRGALTWETAAFAVGHYKETANPGEPGNCVLSGHISSINEGDVFRRLPNVKVGDGIQVATGESLFLYRVTEKQTVLPSATHVMDPGEGHRLTLLTCVPDGVFTHRLVVTAVPV